MMFCPPPDEESQHVHNILPPKKHRKIKKKNKKNNLKKEAKKRQAKFANTMSAWAENYAVAATWQLKHQVAYWKARATALEYENKVLHDVIRRNHFTVRSTTNTESEARTGAETDESGTDSEPDEEDLCNNDEDNGLEVSEEFIQFLTANAKFKEDAKRERERLKAKLEADNEIDMQEEPRETTEENRERMKELYGDKWQRISALEMSLLSNFIHESDKSKPMYWPNIPFNFSNS